LRAAKGIIAAVITACLALAPPAAATTGILDGSEGRRTLLVLDPVDLGFEQGGRGVGDFLRKRAAESRRWAVAHGDSARRQLADLRIDPEKPCKEFQCAFDAGSALGHEFVLFGTLAPLGELQAYTLNLLHVPTAQVVWSRAGEALRLEDEYPIQAQKRALDWALADLDLSRLDLRKRPGRESVAIFVDGSSVQSKAVHERAVTHLYAARRFDLVQHAEMNDLLAALDASPPAADAPEDSLLALGRKLDVRYVLSSRLARTPRQVRLNLSMHDFEGKARKASLPIRSGQDLGKLLRAEDRFFSKLPGSDHPVFAPRPTSRLKTAGKAVSVVAALAAGAGLGYMAYQSKREADSEYRRFRDSQSQQTAESARQRVLSKDEDASRYGILGGVSMVVGAAIWVF
jgi:hypothetical protein